VAKVLVVDDDAELTTIVSAFLSKQNYTIDAVADGRSAFDLLAVSKYDAIVLDLHLPDTTGFELCAKLRAAKDKTPIIMLTKRSSEDDKETGLDCGADDYLTKPFSLKELAARIRAVIRRSTSIFSNILTCGAIELDPVNHTVTKSGMPIHLSRIDFAVLEFLMRHPQEVFSKAALLARVWTSDSEATDDAVRSSIKRLRQKLDDSDDETSSIIENLRHVGYRIKAGHK
jgi:two-component system, OmpR family, response regulator